MISSTCPKASAVPLNLGRDGALLCAGAALDCLDAIRRTAEAFSRQAAGVRIFSAGDLRPHLDDAGCIGRLARRELGPDCKAVRAILFDKSVAANWQLGWHQDRTIHVRERHNKTGYDNWTVKQGRVHVEPPVSLLFKMLTLRVHLDDVSLSNAPLLIAPGSHRLGLVADSAVDEVAEEADPVACVANAGDVWLYSTLIVHGSQRAEKPQRRLVLQVDYSASALPAPLEWASL